MNHIKRLQTIFYSIALALYATFISLNILLYFLRPDYTLFQTTISEYAVGQFGYIQNIALFVLGLANLSVCRVISLDIWNQKGGKIFTRTIAFSACCTALTSFFNTDVGSEMTLHGGLHVLFASLAFGSFCLVASFSAYYSQFWKGWLVLRTKLILSTLLSIILLGFILLPFSVRGYGEKIFVLFIICYYIYLGYFSKRISQN